MLRKYPSLRISLVNLFLEKVSLKSGSLLMALLRDAPLSLKK
ncbi:MAG: hypothetical protein ACE144_06950 [Thermodesulfobacteriota bacterium]